MRLTNLRHNHMYTMDLSRTYRHDPRQTQMLHMNYPHRTMPHIARLFFQSGTICRLRVYIRETRANMRGNLNSRLASYTLNRCHMQIGRCIGIEHRKNLTNSRPWCNLVDNVCIHSKATRSTSNTSPNHGTGKRFRFRRLICHCYKVYIL